VPALGAHTRPILVELGLSDAEVDALVAAGVARTR
jgi:crotonobetainyl-CoA:carnitine CoA-transferase CaiB-like acyl-CoA transferase